MSPNLLRPNFDEYFMGIVEAVAARADCRRRRCGALIVKDHRIVAAGYNGSAPGGPSCLAGECPRGLSDVPSYTEGNNDYSRCVALHAEMNAIAFANRSDTVGATIFIWGGPPCDMCGKLIRAAGITRVVWPGGETDFS